MSDAISHTTSGFEFQAEPIEEPCLSPSSLGQSGQSPSIEVREPSTLSAPRSVARHRNGMSTAERKRLAEAVHSMRRGGRSLMWLTVEAHGATEHEARQRSDRVKSDFGQIQVRAGDKRYYVEVLEGEPTVHSHIIGATPSGSKPHEIVERLKQSRVYGDNLEGGPVTDAAGLVDYLSKEATPQAHYAACRSFTRNKGPHKLGDGGGDRVRLSRQLDADLLRKGLVERRRRTYRKHGLKPPPRALVEGETQLPLFPHLAKPVSRVHEFGHGTAPPAVALEIEFHRRRLGLTQTELARRAGISQPQLANVIAGRFGLAAWPAARLREALAA